MRLDLRGAAGEPTGERGPRAGAASALLRAGRRRARAEHQQPRLAAVRLARPAAPAAARRARRAGAGAGDVRHAGLAGPVAVAVAGAHRRRAGDAGARSRLAVRLDRPHGERQRFVARAAPAHRDGRLCAHSGQRRGDAAHAARRAALAAR